MKHLSKFIPQFAGIALLAASPMLFAQDSANRLSNPDSTFAMKAAQANMAEIQMGQLASQNGSSADVKSFGQKMVTDHTKANDELKSIASKKSVTLPTGVSAKDQAAYDKVSKLTGAEFDKEFMAEMVSGHKEAVSLFQKEATSGTDPDLKSYASSTLPTIQQHLEMAQSDEMKLKK
jgi:putative membrane protein